MLHAKQQRQLRHWFTSPFVLAGSVALVLLLGWSVVERGIIAFEADERRQQVEEEVVELRQRQLTLEADVEYLQSERGQEAEMRRQFDVALPGEKVVVIVNDEQQASAIEAVDTASTSEDRPARWYEFWR